MNKTFDFQRLGAVIRWDLLNYWKRYLNCTIGLAISLSVYSIVLLYSFQNYMGIIFKEKDGLAIFMQDKFCPFFIFIATFIFFIFASNIFGNMKTKLLRESYLMLPATKIEKYISRFLLMTIGTIIITFIALVIADVIQFIFSFFVTPGFHASITWETFHVLLRENDGNGIHWMGVGMIVSLCLFVHSFFALGGSFYRRNPVLLTTCTAIFLCLVFGYWGVHAAMGLFPMDFNPNADIADIKEQFNLRVIICSIFFLIIAVFNYWASYKIFCRMQVICNKWINI